MSYKRLKQKVVMLSEEELHYCEVLKNVYKINPSQFIKRSVKPTYRFYVGG